METVAATEMGETGNHIVSIQRRVDLGLVFHTLVCLPLGVGFISCPSTFVPPTTPTFTPKPPSTPSLFSDLQKLLDPFLYDLTLPYGRVSEDEKTQWPWGDLNSIQWYGLVFVFLGLLGLFGLFFSHNRITKVITSLVLWGITGLMYFTSKYGPSSSLLSSAQPSPISVMLLLFTIHTLQIVTVISHSLLIGYPTAGLHHQQHHIRQHIHKLKHARDDEDGGKGVQKGEEGEIKEQRNQRSRIALPTGERESEHGWGEVQHAK